MSSCSSRCDGTDPPWDSSLSFWLSSTTNFLSFLKILRNFFHGLNFFFFFTGPDTWKKENYHQKILTTVTQEADHYNTDRCLTFKDYKLMLIKAQVSWFFTNIDLKVSSYSHLNLNMLFIISSLIPLFDTFVSEYFNLKKMVS